MVSSDFGQLAVSRHLTSGIDCATAGAASVDAAIPAAPTLRNSRRFMGHVPPDPRAPVSGRLLGPIMGSRLDIGAGASSSRLDSPPAATDARGKAHDTLVS